MQPLHNSKAGGGEPPAVLFEQMLLSPHGWSPQESQHGLESGHSYLPHGGGQTLNSGTAPPSAALPGRSVLFRHMSVKPPVSAEGRGPHDWQHGSSEGHSYEQASVRFDAYAAVQYSCEPLKTCR